MYLCTLLSCPSNIAEVVYINCIFTVESAAAAANSSTVAAAVSVTVILVILITAIVVLLGLFAL